MTLKTNELRIGNYLNGKQGHVIVTEIRANNSVKIQDNTSSFYVGTCLMPIELTRGWVNKFGFKFIWGGSGEDYVFSYGEKCNTIDLIQRGTIFKYGLRLGSCEIQIKYVHQLQNLYFVLTGEELTLKNNSNN